MALGTDSDAAGSWVPLHSTKSIKREPRLVDPGVRELEHRLSRCLLQGRPQVRGLGVPAGEAAHVEPDPVPEGLLAQPRLDHAEHRPALLVGDEVEGLAHVLGVPHLGVHRVGGP